MEYRCRLVTTDGAVTEEICVADSEARLRHELEQRGVCVLSVKPRRILDGVGATLGITTSGRRRVPHRQFLVFNQELATLLKAGLPLVQSLDILRQRLTHPVLKPVLDDVYTQVRAGTSLSDAFAAHGDLFPGIYTASLLAGEKSGSLEHVLRRYVAFVKVIEGVRRRTISALVYPAILTVLALVVVGIIVFRVIPEFAAFYESLDADLPITTRVIVGVATFLSRNALWVLLFLVAAVSVVWVALSRPTTRARIDQWVLRLPLVGATVRKFETSQLARTLGTLLGGGIPLVNAVEVASRSIGNKHMADEMSWVAARVREGQSFSASLDAHKIFPPVAVKMAEVGESTGALQEMLNSLADFYDEEIETDLGRFVTVIEPALLVIMGVVIASLLLSLYLPLIQLSSVVGRAG